MDNKDEIFMLGGLKIVKCFRNKIAINYNLHQLWNQNLEVHIRIKHLDDWENILFCDVFESEILNIFSEIEYKSHQNASEHKENGNRNRLSLRKVNFISSIFASPLRKLHLFLFSYSTPFSEEDIQGSCWSKSTELLQNT